MYFLDIRQRKCRKMEISSNDQELVVKLENKVKYLSKVGEISSSKVEVIWKIGQEWDVHVSLMIDSCLKSWER